MRRSCHGTGRTAEADSNQAGWTGWDCIMMSAVDMGEAGRRLWAARRLGQQIQPPSRSDPGFSVTDGYAVGRWVHEQQIRAGARQAGAKLGFTNEMVWKQLGLSTPFWSPIYDTTLTDSPVISLVGLVQPRIEPEIMVGFHRDVPADASPGEIAGAIGWAAAGFEIVQCHYPRWDMAPADAIADAGLHALLVVGERVEMTRARAPALADVEVELWQGGKLAGRGQGSHALGGPLRALSWLLRLPGMTGLRSGDIVTTGTLTAAHPIAAGQHWQLAAIGGPGLQSMTIGFDTHRA
jgi:2-keto-4-pentenoate hydratase